MMTTFTMMRTGSKMATQRQSKESSLAATRNLKLQQRPSSNFLLEQVAQNSNKDRDRCQGFSCIDYLARHNGAKTTMLRFMVMAINRATPSPPQSNMQSFLPHGAAATRWHELISSGQWWLSKSAALRHATAMVFLWSFVTATLRAARGSGKTPAKTRTLFTWLRAPESDNGKASTTAAALWLDYKGGAPGHSDLFTDELGVAGEWSPARGLLPFLCSFFHCFFFPLPSLAAIRDPFTFMSLMLL